MEYIDERVSVQARLRRAVRNKVFTSKTRRRASQATKVVGLTQMCSCHTNSHLTILTCVLVVLLTVVCAQEQIEGMTPSSTCGNMICVIGVHGLEAVDMTVTGSGALQRSAHKEAARATQRPSSSAGLCHWVQSAKTSGQTIPLPLEALLPPATYQVAQSSSVYPGAWP